MARPRSARAHSAVLDAATALFTERGIDSTSMDAIAALSGVSKATIYKHWPDKDKLALEVLSHLHGLDEEQPIFHSGDQLDHLRADLISQLTYQPAPERTELKERLMPHLMAYSIRNQEFGLAWRKQVVGRHRTAISVIFERAVNDHLLCPLDPETGFALLFGPILYKHIFLSPNKVMRPPIEFVEQVVDAFLRAFAA